MTGQSSNVSFVPRPTDWGKMDVEHKKDDCIVMLGEGDRRLEVEDTGSRRPVVIYEAPGTSGYIAEGNLRNPTTRAQWAREIAGPSLDLQLGVKADLTQAAGEWHKKLRMPSAKMPTAAVLADESWEMLSKNGTFYCKRDLQDTYWLDKKNGKLQVINSNAIRDSLLAVFSIVPAQFKSAHIVSGLESLARTNAPKVDVHRVYATHHDALYVYGNDGYMWRVRAGESAAKRVSNGTDGILFEHTEGLPRLRPATSYTPGTLDRLFCRVIRSNSYAGISALGQHRLLVSYLVAALVLPRDVTHPILTAIGDGGAGKTEGLAVTILQLVHGVRNRGLVTTSDNLRDIETTLTQFPFACLDNVDGPQDNRMLNLIAAAASRASTSHRKLYTDSTIHGEVMDCNLLMTSRNPHFDREDIAQRMLPFFLRPYVEGRDKRMKDRELADLVDQQRDWAWAELFWLAGQVLAHLRNGVTVESGLRLADFAGVVQAVALVEGWAEEVPALLAGVQTAQLRLLAAGDDVIAALIEYAKNPTKPLEKLRAAELLEELRAIRPQVGELTATKLAATLKKRSGALGWIGIRIRTHYDAHARASLYTVEVDRRGPAEVVGDDQ